MNEMITSRKVSSVLNKAMKPLLLKDGFTHFKGRSAYKFEDRYTIGFSTRAVGAYFAM